MADANHSAAEENAAARSDVDARVAPTGTAATAGSGAASGTTAGRQLGNYAVSDERRTFPELSDLIRPGNQFHWCVGLIESWVFSRRYSRLLLGIFFPVAMIGGVLFMWWLKHAPDDQVLAQLEAGVDAAVAADDPVRQENYLTALMQLRPRDPKYRFRLGLFLVENGRQDGLTHILELAPPNTDGYVPARLWLVDQAQQPSPLVPLTDDQLEAQLQRILQQDPDNVDAHQLLSAIYVRKSEFKLAEDHLQQAARLRPELNLNLAQLKTALKRPGEDIRQAAEAAQAELSRRLESNRADVTSRIALAEARLLLQQEQEARELLVSGLKQQDEPRLRKALSDFDLMVAERRLNQSGLNRDICSQLITGALATDPSNPVAIQLLLRVQAMGAQISREALEPGLQHWQSIITQEPENDDARLHLSQLLAVANAAAEAADVLQPLAARRPELRLPQARLLKAAARTEAATQLTEQLLAESAGKLKQNPQDVTAAAEHAEALLLLNRQAEAREFLKRQAGPSEQGIPSDRLLQALYGQICLSLYDAAIPPTLSHEQLATAGATASEDELLQLLSEAFACQATTVQAVDRLAKLTFSQHPAAARAEQIIRQLRLTGDPGANVLNLLGMHALQARQYARATTWLEQANNQTRSTNPMILNNLAIALVRGESPDLNRALELANQTLKLLPDHPDALSTRGEIYVAMQRWTDAFGDLQRALPYRQQDREIHVLLQQVHTQLNQPDMAEAHRQAAEKLGGS